METDFQSPERNKSLNPDLALVTQDLMYFFILKKENEPFQTFYIVKDFLIEY